MMPIVAFNLHLMIEIMGNAIEQLRKKGIEGIQADEKRCREYAEKSLGLAAVLSPIVGYARAAGTTREALRRDETIGAIAMEKGMLTREQAERLFDLKKLSLPSVRTAVPGQGKKR
jgi:aspartate ammonia-lyase